MIMQEINIGSNNYNSDKCKCKKYSGGYAFLRAECVHTLTYNTTTTITQKCNSRWECNFGLEIFARLKRWIHKKICCQGVLNIFYVSDIEENRQGMGKNDNIVLFQPCGAVLFFKIGYSWIKKNWIRYHAVIILFVPEITRLCVFL